MDNLKKIKIYKGLNIIFGNKATGKTLFLKSLQIWLEKKEKKSKLYLGDKYKENFKELTKEKKIDTDYISKVKSINENINVIINFSDDQFDQFDKFYFAIKSDNNKKIKIQESNNQYVNEPDKKDGSTYKYLENAKNNIKAFFYNIKKLNNNKEYNFITKDISKTLKQLWKDLVNIYKKYWKFRLKEKIIEEISELLKKEKNITSSPPLIGLYRKWKKRQNLKNEIKTLYNVNFNKEKNCSNYFFSNRKTLILKKITKSIIFKNKIDKKTEFINIKKSYKSKYNKIFYKIFDIMDINYKKNPTKIIKNAKIFVNNQIEQNKKDKFWWLFIKKIFYWNETEHIPSNGEQSFIVLMNFLKKHKKTMILSY